MLFDRVMCSGVAFNPNLWPLCLCSCILLCAHQSEPRAPGAAAPPGGVQGPGVWPSYDSIALLTGFGVDALVAMERNICGWLQVRSRQGSSADRRMRKPNLVNRDHAAAPW